MTPEAIQQFFDTQAIFIMFAWGVVVKYVPQLAKIPNAVIGWINLAGYILAKFIVPDAHAGVVEAIPDAVGVVIGGATSAGWAMILYETFGRTLLEKWLKLKKAVPKGVTK